ncbi:hypothetical protein [Niabella hibiscisoli]|uniref:hypothetical protein n=1 Tax=Niabella hibiscisoli TaxID=1825928 RepID=UPI001F1006A4|nr:hypothetical protein [Niabella hibiscisoli]MCH5714891.1 hypothetical protein [Niabella hibiscisoli]
MKKTFALLLIVIGMISCKKDSVAEKQEETTKIPENVEAFYLKIAGKWKLNEWLCAGCGPAVMPNQVISINQKGAIEINTNGSIQNGNLDLTGAIGCNENSFRYLSVTAKSIGLEDSDVLVISDCASGGFSKYVKAAN